MTTPSAPVETIDAAPPGTVAMFAIEPADNPAHVLAWVMKLQGRPMPASDVEALAAYCAEPVDARRGRRPPIRTDRDGRGHPPSAPIETEADAHRHLLPAPTTAEILAARTAAGHTQRHAADIIGARRWQTWSDYERGAKPMPAMTWTWYLLATGQHPCAKLIRASR